VFAGSRSASVDLGRSHFGWYGQRGQSPKLGLAPANEKDRTWHWEGCDMVVGDVYKYTANNLCKNTGLAAIFYVLQWHVWQTRLLFHHIQGLWQDWNV